MKVETELSGVFSFLKVKKQGPIIIHINKLDSMTPHDIYISSPKVIVSYRYVIYGRPTYIDES